MAIRAFKGRRNTHRLEHVSREAGKLWKSPAALELAGELKFAAAS